MDVTFFCLYSKQKYVFYIQYFPFGLFLVSFKCSKFWDEQKNRHSDEKETLLSYDCNAEIPMKFCGLCTDFCNSEIYFERNILFIILLIMPKNYNGHAFVQALLSITGGR